MGTHLTYSVYRSGSGDANLLAGATREDAERYARDRSASDAEGTYVVDRDDTWRWVAEYSRGELRRQRAR